jgi:hypothetical protein
MIPSNTMTVRDISTLVGHPVGTIGDARNSAATVPRTFFNTSSMTTSARRFSGLSVPYQSVMLRGVARACPCVRHGRWHV